VGIMYPAGPSKAAQCRWTGLTNGLFGCPCPQLMADRRLRAGTAADHIIRHMKNYGFEPDEEFFEVGDWSCLAQPHFFGQVL
jgi:hypothetical protein